MLIWIIVGILAVLLLLPRLQRREGMDSYADFKVRFVALVSTTYLQISQLEVMYKGENIAKGKRVGTRNEIMPGMAELAVDGTSEERAFPDIYQSGTEEAGWVLDLGDEYAIEEIIYYNRSDGCADRATKMHMFLFDSKFNQVGPTGFTFTDEPKQIFQFAEDTSDSNESGDSGSSQCSNKITKLTCNGSKDEDGEYCSWSDARNSCSSPLSVNQSSTSNSSKCSVKTSKNSCTSTVINAEDGLYCSWSDAKNECSYTSAGTGGSTYNASSGVNLPTNVSNSCPACTGAGYFWNPTTKACTVTDTPGYSRSC